MLEKNVAGLDRTVRLVLGVALVTLAIVGRAQQTRRLDAGLLVLGAGFLLSAITRRCTVNSLLGIDTCSRV